MRLRITALLLSTTLAVGAAGCGAEEEDATPTSTVDASTQPEGADGAEDDRTEADEGGLDY